MGDLYQSKVKLDSTSRLSYQTGPLYEEELLARDNSYCMKKDDFKEFVEEWVKFQNLVKAK